MYISILLLIPAPFIYYYVDLKKGIQEAGKTDLLEKLDFEKSQTQSETKSQY